jgi:endonuclease-3 related protein|tara:strand:+ start:528 stop:1160 length:633 start_codon:yes stop_codon:yes gene_type:complete
LNKNGPLKWWPVKFDAKQGFEIVTGAILVQNTTWRNAERALANMHAEGIWGYKAVQKTTESKLAAVIRSSGYHNAKAKKLKAFAKTITCKYNNDDEILFAHPLPELRRQLLSIYGIGNETADDIILYAAKKPSFIIDTYTRRIVDRLGWEVSGNTYQDYQRVFSNNLEANVKVWGEFHAQLDIHATQVCLKVKPLCGECVLTDICPTSRQ